MKRLLCLTSIIFLSLTTISGQDTWEDAYKEVIMAYTEGKHEKIISIFEKMEEKSLPKTEEYCQLIAIAGQAYSANGDRDKASDLTLKSMNCTAELSDDEDTKRLTETVNQMMAEANKQSQAYEKQQQKKTMQEEGQIASIMNRIGDVDSSNRYDANQAFEMSAGYMKIMIENSDLSPERKAEALKLAEEKSMSGWVKVMGMVQGQSDEEIAKNMKLHANDMMGNNPIEVCDDDDLTSLSAKMDNNMNSLLSQSQELTDGMMDRFDDNKYNPVKIKSNIDLSIVMFEALEWPSKDELSLIASILKKEKTEDLTTEQSATLFISYLQQKNPSLSKESLVDKKAQFIICANDYKAAIKAVTDSDEMYANMNELAAAFGQEGDEEDAGWKIDFLSTLVDMQEMVAMLPVLRIAKDEYAKVNNLIDLRDVNNLRFESNQLEEMGKYKDINLNVFASILNESSFNPFLGGADNISLGYNKILAAKGADYRAKRFLLEGVKQSSSSQIKKDYDQLRSIRNEMGEVHLLDSAQQIELGWTREKYAQQIELANNLQRKVYKQIANSADFVAFANQWVIKWEEIQKSLNSDEAFVDIYRVQSLDSEEDYSYLYVLLQKDAQPEIFQISKDEVDLEKKFIGYRTMVNNDREFDDAYKIFWQPIASRYGSSSKIYLSADGIYHNLSIEGLKDNQQKYVTESAEIIRLVEISDIRRIKRNEKYVSPAIDKMTLFGLPDYDTNPADEPNVNQDGNKKRSIALKGKFRREPLEEINGTLEEVNMLDSLANSLSYTTLKLIKEQATEEQFEKNAASSQILHIATHGAFYGKRISSLKDKQAYKDYSLQKFAENPLLRSHIYLAGANKTLLGKWGTQPDGIITGEDVAHMDLSETELVVLSACESGLGQTFTGEGVFGLQRAFLQSGAKTLIITLWRTGDYSTRYFMEFFYENWLVKKQTKREAFNNARKELMAMDSFKDPAFWAPFIMVGE